MILPHSIVISRLEHFLSSFTLVKLLVFSHMLSPINRSGFVPVPTAGLRRKDASSAEVVFGISKQVFIVVPYVEDHRLEPIYCIFCTILLSAPLSINDSIHLEF